MDAHDVNERESRYVVRRLFLPTPDGTLSVFAGTGTTGAPAPGTATSSPLYDPEGIAVDPSGNVYIANFGSNEILKVTPSGTRSVFAGTGTQGASSPGPATSSNLYGPNGVAVDPSGNVYIADTGNYKVEKVTPGGTLSTIAGNGTTGTPTPGPATSSHLGQVAGVAVDASGVVYLSDANNAEVDKVANGVLSVVAGTGSPGSPTFGGSPTSSAFAAPRGLVTAGSALYISDLINNIVARVGTPVPASTASPAITGTAQSGQTLTTSMGAWSNSPTSYGYQWQQCDASGSNCADISGATTSSYTLTSSDARLDTRCESSSPPRTPAGRRPLTPLSPASCRRRALGRQRPPQPRPPQQRLRPVRAQRHPGPASMRPSCHRQPSRRD